MVDRSDVRLVVWLLLVFAGGSGCALPDATDPNTYPYRLETDRDVRPFMPVDLEGDGRHERVFRWIRDGRTGSPNAVVLATLGGRTIQQVNYAGTVVDRIETLDLDSDGTRELLVPILRNDSLYISIVSAEGRKQGRLFVTSGQPRQEPEGALPWDPGVRYAAMVDATGDGRAELVVVAVTRYAQLPRGVWVFAWPGRQLLGKHVVGALISGDRYVGNFDEDSYGELFFTSAASDNGAVAGGLDDQHAYIGAFELRGTPRLEWTRKLGNIWSSARLAKGDVDGDGTDDVFVYEWKTRARAAAASLRRIDPGTGRVIRQRMVGQQIRDVATVDLDGDARDEVLVADGRGTVRVLNGDLEALRREPVAEDVQRFTILPDADNDGTEEIVLTTSDATVLLDRHLDGKAYMPSRGGGWSVVRRGDGQPPILYAKRGDRAALFRLQANPMYLAYRYGPWLAWLIGPVGLVGIGWAGYAALTRVRQAQAIENRVMETSDDGLLVVEAGRVIHANHAARRRLGLKEDASGHADLNDQAPGLLRLAEDAQQQGQPVEDTINVAGADDPVPIVVAPLHAAAGTAEWLVRVREPKSADADYRTWGLMARRVAHDLKNPLTSILLTLQRLQMEYRERAPDAADDLDAYTTRIEERIEHLRRMTKNFMKFIDAETPTLVRTDLNAFIAERADLLRTGLPPDIELMLKCGDAVPPVHLDAEQMQSVLENLIANAVNALPEGGRITIATRLERGLRLHPAASPRDYAEIEVQDTGVGMTAATRERLFEPGFTTSDDGTGLGLAIVQKVVRDHDGHIQVESESGVGSAFCLHLPAGERSGSSSQR